MLSRKKNQNTYTNLIIVVASIVVILLVGFLVFRNVSTARTRRAVEFNKTHFNTNVKIYDVSVGNKTVNQAVKAINENGKNRATLKGNQIVLSRTNDEIITKAKVESYFKQQKTKYPSNKEWNFENKDLREAQNKLQEIKNHSVRYNVAGETYNFKRAEYFKNISYYDHKYHFGDTKVLKEKIEKINHKVNTFHKKYPFKLPDGNTITVKNESYGWAINTKYLIPAIEEALSKGTKEINGKDYIYGLGYSTYGTGYGKSNYGIGDTYIVVSIHQQKVWFYRHGKQVLVLNDVVTGTAATNPNTKTTDETPTGVWYIQYKESPSVLRGQNDDGSSYASEVQYWMPFTVSGCGFHDASWRTDWSKTAYLEGGSHGCVNIRPSEIKKVWDVVEQYEPVIVYK